MLFNCTPSNPNSHPPAATESTAMIDAPASSTSVASEHSAMQRMNVGMPPNQHDLECFSFMANQFNADHHDTLARWVGVIMGAGGSMVVAFHSRENPLLEAFGASCMVAAFFGLLINEALVCARSNSGHFDHMQRVKTYVGMCVATVSVAMTAYLLYNTIHSGEPVPSSAPSSAPSPDPNADPHH